MIVSSTFQDIDGAMSTVPRVGLSSIEYFTSETDSKHPLQINHYIHISSKLIFRVVTKFFTPCFAKEF